MAKMLVDSPTTRRNIRLIIAILQSYAPFCLAYTSWVLLAKLWHPLAFGRSWFLNNHLLWNLWMPEALFYLFFLAYAQWIQRKAIHPPMRTRDERLALFTKVRAEIYDPQTFLSLWFRGANVSDIGKEEMRRFLDWAFWEGRLDEAKEQGDSEELEEYLQKVEKMMPAPFVEGKGKARSLRLTLDPIEIEPRSLLWYALMGIADTVALILLMAKGFQYYRRSVAAVAAVFPPRPIALCTRTVSVAPDYSYFLRKHTSKTRLPIVYIHGIGIGLLPHVPFLDELHHALNDGAAADDQVGVLAIEILQISSRLTTAIPRKVVFLSQLTAIIDHHFGSGRFVLASHSYGSVLSTHVMNDPSISPRISATLLIDPVTILLHMPDVAYNFTVRAPQRANEWQLFYFASRDPQIATTLGRHFFWSENVLWKDQIDHLITNHNMRLTASLSSDDLIVNTNAVRAYLTGQDLPVPVLADDGKGEIPKDVRTRSSSYAENKKPEKWEGPGLEVMWWRGYDHAGVYDLKEDRSTLVDVLVEYVRGS